MTLTLSFQLRFRGVDAFQRGRARINCGVAALWCQAAGDVRESPGVGSFDTGPPIKNGGPAVFVRKLKTAGPPLFIGGPGGKLSTRFPGFSRRAAISAAA